MSDADLRQLEREFRDQGTVEAEAAYLRARLQAGQLEQSKLELAAYCGHQAARAAIGKGPTWECGPACLNEPIVSSVLHDSGCEHHVDLWFSGLQSQPGREFELRRLFTWALGCWRCGDSWSLEREEMLRARGEWCVCEDLRSGLEEAEGDLIDGDEMEIAILDGLGRCAPWPEPELNEGFRTAIRAELVPWLLGYSDPVRERVEAREQGA